MGRWSLTLTSAVIGLGCAFESGGFGSAGMSSTGTGSTNGSTASATAPSTTQGTFTSMHSGSGSTSGSASTTAASTASDSMPTATNADTTEGEDDTGSSSGGSAGLVNRGLLTRYTLDEADSGQDPPMALDHSGNDFHLPISYSGINQYILVDGHHGMEWTDFGGPGAIANIFDGTSVGNQLEGSTRGTIEVVVDVDDVDSNGSRLSHIGFGSDSDFSLAANNLDTVDFRVTNDPETAVFDVDFLALNRCVIQAVFDSNEPATEDRMRLYVNGMEVLPSTPTTLSRGETISFLDGAALAIGNRQDGMRSFQGVLFYAALYSAALTAEEAQSNAEILLLSDDTPT